MRRLSAAFGAVVLCLLSSPAYAATVTVTNTNDSGPGSLRQAIGTATWGDTITFSVPLPATIELTSGEIVIDRDLTIEGPGAPQLIVRRSAAAGVPAFRIFRIAGSTPVSLSGMTISNGTAINGGGISSFGDLTLRNVLLTGNTAMGGGLFGGGAISVGSGQLTISNSTIDSNVCGDAVTTCVGGAIEATSGPATLRISGTAITNNTATYGGGLFVGRTNVTLDMSNSTISGNRLHHPSAPYEGNALMLYALSGVNVARLSAVTIVSPDRSSVAVWNAGALPRVEFTSTILSGAQTLYAMGSGTIVSHGFNIATDFQAALTSPGDLVVTDPVLGPLGSYGGPTATHRLLSGSPAIDAGTCGDAATGTIAVDQRGIARPQGDACDIGAFEAERGGLANLDAPVSSRASQSSVEALQSGISELQTAGQKLDVTLSSRASQGSVDAINGIISGTLDAAISSRATQSSIDAVQTGLGSVETGLGSVQTGLGGVQSGLGTLQSGLGSVQTDLGSVHTGLGAVQTNLGGVQNAVSSLATQASVTQLGSGLGTINTNVAVVSGQLNGVSTQVASLSGALDAAVSTRASQASLDAIAAQIGTATTQRAFVELQLASGTRLSSLYLPAAFGGQLEAVRDLVRDTLAANKQAGIDVRVAEDLLAAGNLAFANRYYKIAYEAYARAYQVCVR